MKYTAKLTRMVFVVIVNILEAEKVGELLQLNDRPFNKAMQSVAKSQLKFFLHKSEAI